MRMRCGIQVTGYGQDEDTPAGHLLPSVSLAALHPQVASYFYSEKQDPIFWMREMSKADEAEADAKMQELGLVGGDGEQTEMSAKDAHKIAEDDDI